MDLSRRSFLRNGTAAGIGGGLLSNARDLFDRPVSAALSRTLDVDGDGSKNVQFASVADPAGERGRVVRATSRGVETNDYAISMQNLTFAGLRLEDLVDDGLRYDYYVGADNTSMAPNEVCLVLTGLGNGLNLVFRTKDDERDGGWYTRDVAPELTGDSDLPGSDQPWKRVRLTRNNALSMDASTVEHLSEDLFEHFDAGTRVRAAGLGHGSPTMAPSVIDTYYDGFTVAGREYDPQTTN